MSFFRYETWPWIKVKIIYWWWIIRYGGKKNIPLELIFGQITKSIEDFKENLEKAFSFSKDDMSKEELLNFYKITEKINDFKKEIDEAKRVSG